MKITIFQSEKGDCLLLETDDGKLILTDGGMRPSYQKHVAPALGRLREANRALDLVYLSHIDQDHIAGVLKLMDDLVAWRVYDHQKRIGNPRAKKPDGLRPPEVRAIWHNAFHEQVGKNHGPIGDMLAASASILAAAHTPDLRARAEEHEELALSQWEAMQLARRVGAGQLGIPLNREFGGKLIFVRPGANRLRLGRLSIEVIGPFAADLEKLRKEWNDWLEENTARIEELRRRSAMTEDELGNDVPQLLRGMQLAAEVFGDRRRVTTPNLASLMLYLEEPGANGRPKRYVFTGDGHQDDILKGLKRAGKLDQQGGAGLHVDVLKGQHHGSENNWDAAFARAVTADHYVFCGNGEHENPNLGVLKLVLNSRIGPASQRSRNAETDRPFTFWFSSNSEVVDDAEARAHMRKVERLMADAAARNGNVRFRFNRRSSETFRV